VVYGLVEVRSNTIKCINSNIIDYITISTIGNAIDFGDLTVVKQYGNYASSSTTLVED
jgi:hypothetical protein